jgi:hypothetical protein
MEGVTYDVFKPQYLDFTSPLFVTVLRSNPHHPDGSIALEEVLPSRESYPLDREGNPWAVELLLDSLVLRRREFVAPGSTQEFASLAAW